MANTWYIRHGIPLHRHRFVVAVGRRTEFWDALRWDFPRIANCCLDVRDAFHTEEYERGGGPLGFCREVRERIKSRPAWNVVWEIASVIFSQFDLLIVVCNHGKHRSLAFAYEFAQHMEGELLSHQDRWYKGCTDLTDVRTFYACLAPRLAEHERHFGDARCPIIGIGKCIASFDGPMWTTTDENHGDDRYIPVEADDLHRMQKGDLVVRVHSTDQSGWAKGTLVRGDKSYCNRWYPPTYVQKLCHSHFGHDFEHKLFRELWRSR